MKKTMDRFFRKLSGRQKKITGLIIIFLISTIMAAHYLLRNQLPDPDTLELEEVPTILASDAFWGLQPQDRHEYARTAVESFIIRTAAEYAEQPPEKRDEYFADLIERVENMSRQFRGLNLPASRNLEQEGREAREAARREHRERSDDRSSSRAERAMQQLRYESERLDATSRAQVINFMIDLHNYLQNR